MAHKTLIDGTVYEVKGGRTLINGTGYSIKGGRTLVDGTAYEISFSKAYTLTVNMNQNGGKYMHVLNVTIKSGGVSTTYSNVITKSFEVLSTDQVLVEAVAGGAIYVFIYLNGTEVAKSEQKRGSTSFLIQNITGNISIHDGPSSSDEGKVYIEM